MNSLPIKFQVDGSKWVVIHHDREGLWGECDYETNTITIHTTLRNATLRRLEILLHEILHACFPDAEEHQVDQAGKILSRVTWKDGWRRKLASHASYRKRGTRLRRRSRGS